MISIHSTAIIKNLNVWSTEDSPLGALKFNQDPRRKFFKTIRDSHIPTHYPTRISSRPVP